MRREIDRDMFKLTAILMFFAEKKGSAGKRRMGVGGGTGSSAQVRG